MESLKGIGIAAGFMVTGYLAAHGMEGWGCCLIVTAIIGLSDAA